MRPLQKQRPKPDLAPERETLGWLPIPLVTRDYEPHVAIVIPVFNESKGLEQTYEAVTASAEALDVPWSLLFVNDASSDDTIAILERLHRADPHVSYVALSRNFGHQAALTAGLEHAEGDVFVTMDGDLQHPPELLGPMLDAWRDGYDVVHTRKVMTEDLGRTRAAVTRLAYRAIGWVASVRLVPQASDFRLLDRAARDRVCALPERGRLYRGLTPWVGYRQTVLPFVAPARAHGSSNYSFRQLVNLFTRSFFDFSSAPLYAALILATVAIVACFAYVAFVLAALAIGAQIPPGYVSLIVAILFLSSVNLAVIGVLSVYVARIYDEVRGRPTYLVALTRIHQPSTTRVRVGPHSD